MKARFDRLFFEEGVPLRQWCKAAELPGENMIWRPSYEDQLAFVCRELPRAWGGALCDNDQLRVVGTHVSKSLRVPVYGLRLPEHGVRAVLRSNFYDWKVSVLSDRPLDEGFGRLFDPCKVHTPEYCEGIPPDLVFGSYVNDATTFTVAMPDRLEVFAFFVAVDRTCATHDAAPRADHAELVAAVRARHEAAVEEGELPQVLRAFCVCGFPTGPGTAACESLRGVLRGATA